MTSFTYYVPPLEAWLLDALPRSRATAEDIAALEKFVEIDPADMKSGQAETLAVLLTQWFLPDAWEKKKRDTHIGAVLLSKFARWKTLPRQASLTLLSGYLNFMEKAGPMVEPGELSDMLNNSEYLDRKTYNDLVLWQLKKKSLTVSDLGTAYRHLCYMDGGRLGYVETFWAFADRLETPVEVLATEMSTHVVPGFPKEGDLWNLHFDAKRFQVAVETKYPELAGLPWQMLFDVVASQPVDDAWLVNSWELPSPEEVPAW